MATIPSNKPIIILLTFFLLALAGAGGLLMWQALQPIEERQNPTILEVAPDLSTPVSRSIELSIAFDQKMDHQSVEKALSISPDFSYSYEWVDEARGERFIIHPSSLLDWNKTYRLSFSSAARNIANRPLSQAKVFSFTTNRQIQILELLPLDGSQDVSINQPITIRFDRPLLNQSLLQAQEKLPQLVILDPPMLGFGLWLSEDLYAFYPSEPLHGGSHYQVSINPFIAPGMELQEAFHSEFVTEGGHVLASFPFDGASDVQRTASIRFKFSQSMTHESIERNFKIYSLHNQASVAGQFLWEDDKTLVFVPRMPLKVATAYDIAIGASSQGGLASPFRANFTTVDYLAVESVEPPPDSVEISLVPTDTIIALQFNHPVVPVVGFSQKEGLLNPLSISPPLAGKGEWLTSSLFSYHPSESLLPGTEYLISVHDQLQDSVGSFMKDPFFWSFKTEAPRVLRLEPSNLYHFVSPIGPLGLRFNQPMLKSHAESAFTLQENPLGVASSPTVAGRFKWQDDDQLLLFFPDKPLSRDVEYLLSLRAGISAAEGGCTNESFETTVIAAPKPRVVKTVPQEGAEQVSPDESIQITFNTPINPVGVLNHLTIVPTATDVYTYYDADSFSFNFSVPGSLEPSTTYTVTLDDSFRDVSGQKLMDSFVFTFTTAALPAELELLHPGSIIATYNAYTDTTPLVRYRNLSLLEWQLYRMTRSELLPFLTSDAYQVFESYTGNSAALIDSWQVSLANQQPFSDSLSEPWITNVSSLYQSKLPPSLGGLHSLESGIYLLRVSAPERDQLSNQPLESKQIMLLTPVNLTIKRAPDVVLLWATDLQSGLPVSALSIDLLNSFGDVIATGLTDNEGLFRYQIQKQDAIIDPSLPLIAISSSNDQVNGLVSTDWFSGIAADEWGIAESLIPPPLYGTIYTDRAIYRPGQTVYFKGALRQALAAERVGGERRAGAERAVSADTEPVAAERAVSADAESPRSTFTLKINFQGRSFDQRKIVLSPYGTFSGQFSLAQDAQAGDYELSLEQDQIALCYFDDCSGESLVESFQVAEYLPPEFDVKVELQTTAVVSGEELDATVSANYDFGGALSEAAFSWRLTSRDYLFNVPSLSGDWSWQDWQQSESVSDSLLANASRDASSLIDQGESLLKKDGTRTIPINSHLSPTSFTQSGRSISQLYTFEADFRDTHDFVISERDQIIIHAADFYVGINLSHHLGNVAEPFSINLATADTTGELIGGQELQVEFYQRQWHNLYQEADNGSFFWTTSFSDTLLATRSVVSDEKAYTTVSFTPEIGGSYTVLVSGKDKRGNISRSRHFFEITDSHYIAWARENHARISLKADKQQYEVGDVARILIPTPFEGMTALITQEHLTIQAAKVERLAGTAEFFELPITEEMIPNVVVGVVAMTGMSSKSPLPEFRVGNINLNVVPPVKPLAIELLPLDVTEPPEAGKEAHFKIRVKDATGKAVQAELSLVVVDKAMRSLSHLLQPSLLDAFYSPRPLAVRTAVSLVANVDYLSQRFAFDPDGQDHASVSHFATPFIDDYLLETPFWKPNLLTDQQGEAVISFILPDNLTTWMLEVQAIAKDEGENAPLVGLLQQELISTLPLSVYPSFPRFFVAGDQAELLVAVHNHSSHSIQNAQLSFEAEGFIQGGEPVNVDVTIPPGGRDVLSFPVEVLHSEQLAGLEDASITVSVTAGAYHSLVEQKIPIYDLTTLDVVATGGVLHEPEEVAVETIRLPEVPVVHAELNLELAVSLAGATESSLNWLKNYEYANSEWVASILLSHLAKIRVANQLLNEKPNLDSLRKDVSTGVELLLAWQNLDGGWGWWHSEPSQEWLTAYALLALHQAKQAAFELPEEQLARATRFLERSLSCTADLSESATLDRRAFLLYVLSDLSPATASSRSSVDVCAVTLFEQHRLLNDDGKAFLLMALDNLYQDSNHEFALYIETLADELTANARLNATGTHWEKRKLDSWTFDSNIRTTAVVLRALNHLQPQRIWQPILLPQTVRWLVNTRADYSQNTQATAWTLFALSDYMLTSGKLEADFSYQVALNDDILLKEDASEENLSEFVSLNFDLTQLLLRDNAKENRLIINRQPASVQSSKGELYYSAWLHYHLPAHSSTERFEGISVARQYEAVNQATLQSTGVQVKRANVGEVIQVHLTIHAPNDLHFFALEDPIPAGFSFIDPSLLTSSQLAEGLKREKSPFWYDDWSQIMIRDNKIALFSDMLPRGTHEYTYFIRATIPGAYHVLPTEAYETYHRELFGRGSATRFTVER